MTQLMDQSPIGQSQMNALQKALLEGNAAKRLAAVGVLHNELLRHSGANAALMAQNRGMLEGLSVAVSSEDFQTRHEACTVLTLITVTAGAEASFAIASAPYLLHVLVKLAVQQEDASAIDLLATLSCNNDKILWLVTNLSRVSVQACVAALVEECPQVEGQKPCGMHLPMCACDALQSLHSFEERW